MACTLPCARTTGHRRLPRGADAARSRAAARAVPARQSRSSSARSSRRRPSSRDGGSSGCGGWASGSCSRSKASCSWSLHLMIAGTAALARAGRSAIPGKVGLAAFDFPTGTLLLTEAGLEAAGVDPPGAGSAGLAEFERGGLEVLDADLAGVRRAADAREPHAQARADRSARSSAASATPTPTRSCTPRGCRR